MRRGGGRHRRRKLLVAVGVLVIVAVTGVIGLRMRSLLLHTTTEATMARDELLSGARLLKTSGMSLTPAQAAQATAQFKSAESHFADVHAVLTKSLWLRLADSLPVVGTQVSAGRDLSDMGVHLARMGSLLVDVSSSALAELPHTGASSPGEKVLKTLDALDPKLSTVSSELNTVVADRHRLPSSGLLPQLSNAISQLDKKVNLDEIRAGLATVRADEPGLRALLGATGPRTYLVLNQDPAELRATGGFIGTVGFLSFNHGAMAPFDPVNVAAIDKLPDDTTDVLGGPGSASHVDPPYPLQYVFHLRSWELRDANWSPDFPTAAQEAEFLLNRERDKQVDGVIALDPFMIQRLLSLTGPIKVPATGDIVDQTNFYGLTVARRELGSTNQRNNFLPSASKEILTAVLKLPPAKWPGLLQALQASCTSRELQAYFHDANAETLATNNDCDGRVRPSTHDSLMIVESNVGGNKDDFWMKRQYSLDIGMDSNGAIHHTLRLHYSGLSSHGVRVTGYWGYTGWLRIYLPASTQIAQVVGATLTPTAELGHLVIQGWFYVQFDHTVDITISYDEPTNLSSRTEGFSLYWQKQAGRLDDPIKLSVAPPAGWKLTAAALGSDPSSNGLINSDLAVDREFRFEFRKG